MKINIKSDDDIKNDKLHTSRWLLTINTNKAVKSLKDPIVIQFKRHIRNILTHFDEYVKTNGNYRPDPTMITELQPIYEIGPKYHRYHTHIIVTIQHNSNISIDLDALREELPGYYINSTFIRASVDLDKLLNYIRQDM
jgi:hypothetical protein